jgi:ribonuclease P protein component
MSVKKKIQIKRLKGKSTIDLLFKKGTVLRTTDLDLKFLRCFGSNNYNSGVSVPKKIFNKAVERNRIKRKLRAAVKEINPDSLFEGSGMLLYKGEKNPDFKQLKDCVETLFLKAQKANV